MKNNSNIYDIDSEIIRRFDDVHRFTALEATKIREKYLKKIQDLQAKENITEDDEKKLKIYEIYCKNLQNYIFVELQGMSKEQLEEYYKEVLPQKPAETTTEDVEKALEELKNDVDAGIDTENEVQEPTTDDSEDDRDGIFGDDAIIRREPCDVPEKRSITQDDLLVERDNVTTVMDEYVPFTEVNEASDEYVQYE